jgi:ABC-2 type transport system permease protein
MSTTTATPAGPASPAPTAGSPATGRNVSFTRVVRSEAIKLFTLRSTWWSLGITAILAVGISLLMASASASFSDGINPVMVIVAPMQFTMLVAGILGAIAITGEYSTGMIRSTLAAQPRRGVVVAAKAVVVAGALAATTLLTSAVSVVASLPILSGGYDWSDPSLVLLPILWGVIAMATFALLGLGFGFLIRSGAGAIAATVGVLFVLPVVLSMFVIGGEPWQWVVDLGRYLPMSAAQVVTTPGADGFGAAVATLFAWPAATLLAGWAVLRTRDA